MVGPFTTDNPLPLANRKAKRLAAVLKRQEASSLVVRRRPGQGSLGRAAHFPLRYPAAAGHRPRDRTSGSCCEETRERADDPGVIGTPPPCRRTRARQSGDQLIPMHCAGLAERSSRQESARPAVAAAWATTNCESFD